MSAPSDRVFVVYDGRATPDSNTDDAAILVTEYSESQALQWPRGGHVWRYDVEALGNRLINETYIGPTRGGGAQ